MRHTPGERDHLGTARDGEQRPDLRRGHAGRARREPDVLGGFLGSRVLF
jgi:hypothetical protein